MRALFSLGLGCFFCTAVAAADRQTPPVPIPMQSESIDATEFSSEFVTAMTIRADCLGGTMTEQVPPTLNLGETPLARIHAVLDYLHVHPAKLSDLKVDLVEVDSNPDDDIFGASIWLTKGQPARLNRTSWPFVEALIRNALGPPTGTASTFTPQIALRTNIPSAASVPSGYYVLLMSFNTPWSIEVYLNGTRLGASPINYHDSDFRQLREIIKNLQPAPSPAGSSS
jgi:hypothetical protein